MRTRSFLRHALALIHRLIGGIAVARLTTASWPVNTAAKPEQSNSDTDAGIAPCVVIAALFRRTG